MWIHQNHLLLVIFRNIFTFRYNLCRCIPVISFPSSYSHISLVYSGFLQYFNVHIDNITFSVIILNVGILALYAVFFGKSERLTQIFLVLMAVAASWLLSAFPPWTCFVILILMAVYDVAAVLWKPWFPSIFLFFLNFIISFHL